MSELGLYKLKEAVKGAYYFGKLTVKPGVPFDMTYELAAHPLMVHLTSAKLVEPVVEEAKSIVEKVESLISEPKEEKRKKWSKT